MSDNFLKIYNGVAMTPRSTDPTNPIDGDLQFSDGTARTKGLWQYKDGDWAEFGTGSGSSSEINYITNSDAEVDTTGWVKYLDAAGVNPVDGTDGTSTITFSRVDSTLLRGSAHFQIAKTSANRQGNGVSYDFSIDNADKAKKLTISFDYDASHAGYADDDIRLSVYDVTNSTLIRINGEDLKGGKGTHYAQFQTASNSTSYRLIFHVSSTSATAYEVNFDNVKVGPGLSAGSNTEIAVSAYSNGNETIGASTAIPFSTISRDTTSSWSGTEFTVPETGDYHVDIIMHMVAKDDYYGIWVNGSSDGWVGKTDNDDIVNGNKTLYLLKGDVISVRLNASTTLVTGVNHRINITKIGTSSESLAIGGGREINLRASGNDSDVITANTEDIPFKTVNRDTTGSWSNGGNTGNNTNDQFTIPESGTYAIDGSLYFPTTAKVVNALLAVNGTVVDYIGYNTSATAASLKFSGIRFFNKGDLVTIRVDQGITLDPTTSLNYISIVKFASPQTQLETETVVAVYSSDAGQSIANNTDVTLVYEDKVFDTHNAYNTSTGEYTTPVTGNYKIGLTTILSGAAVNGGIRAFVKLDVNGSEPPSSRMGSSANNGAGNYTLFYINGECLIPLNKGDVVKVIINHNTGSSENINTTLAANGFSIMRVK